MPPHAHRPCFTFVDLCCGIGGNRVAMERLGGRCVFACELDPDARAVYTAHFGPTPAVAHDLLDVQALPPHDVLCAGPPCRSYSRANKGNCRTGQPAAPAPDHVSATRLWDHLLGLSTATRGALLLESTSTLQTAKEATLYAALLAKVRAHAAEVHDAVLDASEYGVPQVRKRWFCVAFKRAQTVTARGPPSCPPFAFPPPNAVPTPPLASVLAATPRATHVKARSVTFKRSDRTYDTRAQCIGFLDNLNTQNRRVYAADRPGPCLTTTGALYVLARAADGGRGDSDNHKGTRKRTRTATVWLRMLSVDELRAYMGFPADFRVPDKRVLSTRLLGRAVPPPVVEAVGRCVLGRLGVEATASKQ